VFFFAYLIYQYMASDASSDEKTAGLKVEAIKSGKVTLRGVMHGMITTSDGQLMDISEKEKHMMKDILKPFFVHYDNDNNGILSKYEFGKIMADLKEDLTQEAEMALFDSADVDKSGAIDFEEFCSLMVRYTKTELLKEQTRGASKKDLSPGTTGAVSNGNGNGNGAVNDAGDAEEDDEEEEEIPDDLKDLSPEEQQSAIKARACWMMGMGTVLVLIFSDPAVGVLSDIGRRTNISAFYISFVLAPLASNASELVAAYNYGCKKTQAMMTISLSTLLGAGCMNNTFCLAIFFMLIWKQRLTWNYTAEVTSIIFIQVVVGLFAMKKVQMVTDAVVVLLMYPLSIVIVWGMQNILHIP
jgi:Ca2+/Na+ antiporter